MNKLDLIIDVLSISQNSVWSNRNEQALAAARELKALAQPEQNWDLLKATQDSLREHMARIKELEAQIAQPRKPWQGLTSEDWENTPDTGKQGCERDAELFDWIEKTLKDKNDTF